MIGFIILEIKFVNNKRAFKLSYKTKITYKYFEYYLPNK